MKKRLGHLVEDVFHGYGQLFLANRTGPGVLIFLGLFLLSQSNGVLSLLGAFTALGMARILAPIDSQMRSGLVGINGILFGYTWISFPEVPTLIKAILTMAGSAIMALVLLGASRALRNKVAALCLFTLPYVLTMWTCIFLLNGRGYYDRHFAAAWTALAVHAPAQAKEQFAAIEVISPRATAYQHDGLGWASFQLQEYQQAQEHFGRAVSLVPDLADGHDGLGWSCFRLGQYDQAAAEFRQSVRCDPILADSWAGLGWLALQAGSREEANACFGRAVLCAPLFSDAYTGHGRSASLSSESRPARASALLATLTKEFIPARYQLTSLTQLVCWVFFLMAIALHSRISTLIACAGLGLIFACAQQSPALSEDLLDIYFIYNLVTLLLALGGHFMKLTTLTLLWMGLNSIGLALFWHAVSDPLLIQGLPLLCYVRPARCGTEALRRRCATF